MYRLLGPHVNQTWGGIPELVAAWRPPVALVMDHNQAWRWVKESTPQTKFVGRYFQISEPSFNEPMNPTVAARDWVANAIPTIMSMAGVYDWWQGVNEPAIGSSEAMKRYADFEAERVRLLWARGVKSAVASFAVGNPPNMAWWKDFIPALEAARQYGGILLLHEYNWPGLRGDADHLPEWLSLRHRKVYNGEPSHGWDGLPAHLRLPCIIGETGADGGVKEPGWVQGWRGNLGPDEYLQEFDWYDRELQKDKYILGACVFCCGNAGAAWVGYDIWPEPARRMAEDAEPMYRRADPPSPGRARGVDVSWWQGRKIIWRKVAADGVSFAYLRSSVRQSADSTYPGNHKRTEKNGILRGAYHYLYPENPEAQARVFVDSLLEGDLPPMLDVEEAGLTKEIVTAFVDEYERLKGHKPGMYTSMYKWHTLVGQTDWAGDLALWVADWNEKFRGKPRLPGDWDSWEFQQTGSRGQVAGIKGRVDTDIYNGSEAELRAKYSS